MMFYTLVLHFYLKNRQKKEEDGTFLRKEDIRKAKYCYHNKICRRKKEQFF